jgi:hypothetical protein
MLPRPGAWNPHRRCGMFVQNRWLKKPAPRRGRYILPRRGRWWQARFRGSTRIASRRDGLHSLVQLNPQNIEDVSTPFVAPLLNALDMAGHSEGTRAAWHKPFASLRTLCAACCIKTNPVIPSGDTEATAQVAESRELLNPTQCHGKEIPRFTHCVRSLGMTGLTGAKAAGINPFLRTTSFRPATAGMEHLPKNPLHQRRKQLFCFFDISNSFFFFY